MLACTSLKENNKVPMDQFLHLGTKFDTAIDGNRWSKINDLYIYLNGTLSHSFDESLNVPTEPSERKTFIAHCYAKFGPTFYEKLDGLFLIGIYDTKKDLFLICNNRYQTNRAYYTIRNNVLYCSEKLTDLVKNLGKFEVNLASVRSFLSNGFTISDHTQLKGIHKLLPSFAIKVQNGKFELMNHWENEVPFKKEKFNDLETKLDDYEKTYRAGLSRFIEKNKPSNIGTLLSGGHDTSFVMIQASQVWKKPVHAFTITFPGWAFDEGEFAGNICRKFNGTFHPIPFEANDLDDIVSLIRTNEEPVVGSSLPLHKLAREAKNHVDLMLGGDGGDTLWAEYHPVAEYHRYIKNMPLPLRKLAHSLSKMLVKWTDWERFWELEHVSSLFATKDAYDDFMRRLCTYRHFRDEYLEELFTKEAYGDGRAAKSILEIPFNKDNFDNSLVEGKLFNAFYTYQSFHTSKSMEEFGMELYLPTVQRDVIQFVTNLPSKWVNGGTTFHRLTNSKKTNRKFHKQALSRYLKRDEVYNRSFDIPWHRILLKRPEVLELLKKRLISRGWFRTETIEKLFNEFQGYKAKDHEILELKDHGYRIFTLLSLEIWAMEYLDGRLTEGYHNPIKLEQYLSAN